MTITDWQIFFLSALPVTELRVTLPLALAKGITPVRSYMLAVIGNMLPVIPLLFLLQPASRLFSRFPALDRLFRKLLLASRKKGGQISKYGYLGLMLFVAVPLPGTGAWTGAILAWLFGLDIILSALAIAAGIIIAGAVVLLASLGVIKAAIIYDFEVFLVIAVVALVTWLFCKKKKGK